jgi:hypothetical protein
MKRLLVACEYSGRVREAFRKKGWDAWSCDLLSAEDNSPYHIVGDVLSLLDDGWDMMIAHPPCTRLANSGVRWLNERNLWSDLDEACEFYLKFRNAPIPKKAIENPIMHKYAKERIGELPRQIVQPWWFGEPYFKATGFELHGLPDLSPTNRLTPPAKGTPEHKLWSACHMASPGKDRWKERSRTYQGVADAMAGQWS